MLCVLRAIGTRRNSLTLTCRIPTEILVEIFIHYQRPYFILGSTVPARGDKGSHSALYGTSLGWVPAVTHVCRHWRSVAHEHPRLWSNVVLNLGRTWAQRTLALSKASPIVVSLSNFVPCHTIMPTNAVGQLSRPGVSTVSSVDVLAEHLFHIQDLTLRACSCDVSSWVPLLHAAAPLLESLWLCVYPHSSDNTPIALPDNFLATHPRIRHLYLEQAFLASWAPGPGPLTRLVSITVSAPDPRHAPTRAATVVPTREQLLECLSLMPVLEVLCLEHCLPAFVPTFSTRTVPLPHLRAATLVDRVDRCRQLLDALDVPPAAKLTVRCWSASPPSDLDTLRILPSLSAHLSRPGPGTVGGPHALALSSASTDGRTQLTLSAWRAFATPTVAEDCESYAGPKAPHDVFLECEWGAAGGGGDPEMERRALLRACECVNLADLRALELRADAAVWAARDWRAAFAACTEITHVLALDVPAESLLEALGPPDRGEDGEVDGDGHGAPIFQELVSLTLVGVNFVRANDEAWTTLEKALVRRQKSPACVTILDRVELRTCTVAEDAIDALKEFAAVVVWDSVTDPNGWINVPQGGEGDGEGEEEEEAG